MDDNSRIISRRDYGGNMSAKRNAAAEPKRLAYYLTRELLSNGRVSSWDRVKVDPLPLSSSDLGRIATDVEDGASQGVSQPFLALSIPQQDRIRQIVAEEQEREQSHARWIISHIQTYKDETHLIDATETSRILLILELGDMAHSSATGADMTIDRNIRTTARTRKEELKRKVDRIAKQAMDSTKRSGDIINRRVLNSGRMESPPPRHSPPREHPSTREQRGLPDESDGDESEIEIRIRLRRRYEDGSVMLLVQDAESDEDVHEPPRPRLEMKRNREAAHRRPSDEHWDHQYEERFEHEIRDKARELPERKVEELKERDESSERAHRHQLTLLRELLEEKHKTEVKQKNDEIDALRERLQQQLQENVRREEIDRQNEVLATQAKLNADLDSLKASIKQHEDERAAREAAWRQEREAEDAARAAAVAEAEEQKRRTEDIHTASAEAKYEIEKKAADNAKKAHIENQRTLADLKKAREELEKRAADAMKNLAVERFRSAVATTKAKREHMLQEQSRAISREQLCDFGGLNTSVPLKDHSCSLPSALESSLIERFVRECYESLGSDSTRALFGEDDAAKQFEYLIRDFTALLGKAFQDDKSLTKLLHLILQKQSQIGMQLRDTVFLSDMTELSANRRTTACRANDLDECLAYSSTSFTDTTTTDETGVLEMATRLHNINTSGTQQDGLCWSKMVRNPVVAQGYPIPKRCNPIAQKGLEVSLDMMVALSHAYWATIFEATFVLKGLISALVPILEVGSSLVWHFSLNEDGSRMTYQQACAPVFDSALILSGPGDLRDRRHFVGVWSRSARIMAGGDDPSLYDNMQLSVSKRINEKSVALSNMSLSAGQYLTIGGTFTIAKKDTAPSLQKLASRAYEVHIRHASNMSVVFYGTKDRRGWLLDGASALMHLARCWLSCEGNKQVASDELEKLTYRDHRGGRTSAVRALAKNKTSQIRIFEDCKTHWESSRVSPGPYSESDSGYDSPNISQKSKRKTTMSEWSFKELVLDLWHVLEAMHDKLHSSKFHAPEYPLSKPTLKPMLAGWETKDILTKRGPFESRGVELKQTAGP